jgi:hypothetical protein
VYHSCFEAVSQAAQQSVHWGEVEAVVCRLRTRSVWSNAKELPGVDASGGKRLSEGALMAALSLDLLVKRSPITS